MPEAYHELMTSDRSEVIDFYPVDFDTDLNGKKQEWEAVVLIPFIDEVCSVTVGVDARCVIAFVVVLFIESSVSGHGNEGAHADTRRN